MQVFFSKMGIFVNKWHVLLTTFDETGVFSIVIDANLG